MPIRPLIAALFTLFSVDALAVETVLSVTGIVTDSHGRQLKPVVAIGRVGRIIVDNSEGDEFKPSAHPDAVTLRVCGAEHRLPDGTWSTNKTPDCVMPRASVAKENPDGRFTVFYYQDKDYRLNLWFDKPGFAPTFVTLAYPQPPDSQVVIQDGVKVSGTVQRSIAGKLQPVSGATVVFQCASGDLAHQKELLTDPCLTGVLLEGGEDLPYQRRVLTDAAGAYTFHLSPPPPGKKWYAICHDEITLLEVADKPLTIPAFVVSANAAPKP